MGHPAGRIRKHFAPLTLMVATAFLFVACDESVTGPQEAASVVVTPGDATLDALEATVQFSAEARTAGGDPLLDQTFTWSSSNEAVITVGADGLVAAVGNGQAEVTATVQGGGVSGSALVTVQQDAESITVTVPESELTAGESVQATAEAVDANGFALDADAFTWASSDESVATVDDAGLVTAVDDGEAEITASTATAQGDVAISVVRLSLDIQQDTILAGEVRVGELSVAEGVVVTVEGALDLHATGQVEIMGSLAGQCAEISVLAADSLVIEGAVDVPCVAESTAGAPGVRLVGMGGLRLDGAELSGAGELQIGTDSEAFGGPALTALTTGLSDGPADEGVPGCWIGGGTVIDLSAERARDGADGQTGEDGGAGRPARVSCAGNLVFAGVSLRAQDGGHGGDGTHESASEALAWGGAGGAGGDVFVEAAAISFEGENTLRSGDGGHGGAAEAEGTGSGTPASAEGGDAGGGGSIFLVVDGGQDVPAEAPGTSLIFGDGGTGGAASAQGGDGANADAAAADDGGQAVAEGGAGGAGGDLVLSGAESIELQGEFTKSGGEGGRGGGGFAHAGDGGSGNEEHPDGAAGGQMIADGGDGGDSPRETGGNGGNVAIEGGNGGNGWDGCSVEPFLPGGNGGAGGDAVASPGQGGAGPTLDDHGLNGNVFFFPAGNGGAGGDGEDPGAGGDGGEPTVVEPQSMHAEQPHFTDGPSGGPCGEPEITGLWLEDPDETVEYGESLQILLGTTVDIVVEGRNLHDVQGAALRSDATGFLPGIEVIEAECDGEPIETASFNPGGAASAGMMAGSPPCAMRVRQALAEGMNPGLLTLLLLFPDPEPEHPEFPYSYIEVAFLMLVAQTVSALGSDAPSTAGTPDDPLATVTEAAQRAGPGGRIWLDGSGGDVPLVGPPVDLEGNTIEPVAEFVFDQPISDFGMAQSEAAGARPVLVGSGSGSCFLVHDGGFPNTTSIFRGLEVTGCGIAFELDDGGLRLEDMVVGDNVEGAIDAPWEQLNPRTIRVTDSRIENNGDFGIRTTVDGFVNEVDRVIIERSIISGHDVGLDFHGRGRFLLDDSDITGNGVGMRIEGADGHVARLTRHGGSRFDGNETGIWLGPLSSVHPLVAEDPPFSVSDNTGSGIIVDGGGMTGTVQAFIERNGAAGVLLRLGNANFSDSFIRENERGVVTEGEEDFRTLGLVDTAVEDNQEEGIDLAGEMSTSISSVVIRRGSVSGNGAAGIRAALTTSSGIELEDVAIFGNGGDGAELGTAGRIVVSGSAFEDNEGHGLVVSSVGTGWSADLGNENSPGENTFQGNTGFQLVDARADGHPVVITAVGNIWPDGVEPPSGVETGPKAVEEGGVQVFEIQGTGNQIDFEGDDEENG